MAEPSMFDKFKSAFEEDAPKSKTPVPGLDPSKARSFSSVFNGGDDSSSGNDAIKRRMEQLRREQN